MLKLSKIAMSVSACLALTACGGGGGSSGGDIDPVEPTKVTSSLGVVVNSGSSTVDNNIKVCLDVSGKGDCQCESDVTGLSFNGTDGLLSWTDDALAKCSSGASAQALSSDAKVIAVNSNTNLYLGYTLSKISKSEADNKIEYSKLYLNPISSLQDVYGSAKSVADNTGIPEKDFAQTPFTGNDDTAQFVAGLYTDMGLMTPDYHKPANKVKLQDKVSNSYNNVKDALSPAKNWDKNDLAGWLLSDEHQKSETPFGDDFSNEFNEPKPADNGSPKADFSMEYKNSYVVQFTDKSSDPENDALTYAWNFGDGQKSAEKSPVHTYANSQAKSVTLVVCDDKKSCSEPKVMEVNPKKCVENCEQSVNTPPVADFSVKIDQDTGAAIFTNLSTDEDNDTLQSTWNFGNGIEEGNNKATFSYTYGSSGEYTVTLTVDDGRGGIVSKNKTVIIPCIGTGCSENPPVNHAPEANLTHVVGADGVVTFTNGSIDADGDALTTTWVFGDGQTGSDSAKQVKHTYKPGTYTVIITVSDGKESSKASVTVTVPENQIVEDNHAPVANLTYSVGADGVVTFTNGSTDADGDALTTTWSFGDEQTGSDSAKQVQHTYKPGTYTVSIVVSDGKASDTKSITIDIPDDQGLKCTL